MLIRTMAKRPEILTICLANWQIVGTRQAPCHETLSVELPILISIGLKPIPAIIVPFVSKSDCDPIFMESP